MKEIVVTKDVKTSTNLDKGISDIFYKHVKKSIKITQIFNFA